MTTTTFMTTIAAASGANAANAGGGYSSEIPAPFACATVGIFLLVLSTIAAASLLFDYFKKGKGRSTPTLGSFTSTAMLGLLGVVFITLSFILP